MKLRQKCDSAEVEIATITDRSKPAKQFKIEKESNLTTNALLSQKKFSIARIYVTQ
jgi:hypothetical protein